MKQTWLKLKSSLTLQNIKALQLQAKARFKNAPLMTLLFATSTSMLMYQNCSPTAQSTSSSASKTATYSSTIGGANGSLGSGTGTGGGSVMPGGAVTVPGGGGSTGGTTGGGTTGGGTTGGGTTGGTVGGTVPVDTGSTTGAGQPGSGGTGGTGYSGSTGGVQEGLIWQYQPEDRTVEEGDVLTLSSYATKGIDLVTYQWYKNGVALTGQTGYMYRAFLLPLSAAGTYYVIAKSGSLSIQSVSVTVKVKAARNPCPAGAYGVYPGTQNYNELYHESLIGKSNTYTSIQGELADGYTAKLPYGYYGYYYGGGGDCISAVGIFQCRNGKMVSTDQVTCTAYRETGGGI